MNQIDKQNITFRSVPAFRCDLKKVFWRENVLLKLFFWPDWNAGVALKCNTHLCLLVAVGVVSRKNFWKLPAVCYWLINKMLLENFLFSFQKALDRSTRCCSRHFCFTQKVSVRPTRCRSMKRKYAIWQFPTTGGPCSQTRRMTVFHGSQSENSVRCDRLPSASVLLFFVPADVFTAATFQRVLRQCCRVYSARVCCFKRRPTQRKLSSANSFSGRDVRDSKGFVPRQCGRQCHAHKKVYTFWLFLYYSSLCCGKKVQWCSLLYVPLVIIYFDTLITLYLKLAVNKLALECIATLWLHKVFHLHALLLH